MAAQLVETSEEDSFLALARFVGDLLDEGQGRTALADTAGSEFFKGCEQLLAEAQSTQLLERFVGQLPLLFRKSSDKDLECASILLTHLLSRAEPEDVPAAAQSLIQGLTAEVDGSAELRLQTLTQLYNVLADSAQKFDVLLATLGYARRAGLTSQLASNIKARLDAWVKELALDTADERRLCLSAAELLRSSKRKQRSAYARDAFTVTMRALHTSEASSDDTAELREAAASAVAEYARFPDVFHFDLAGSPAIRQLEGDDEFDSLHQLLHLLLGGDVKGLQRWLDSHASVVESYQFVAEDLLAKVRLLALLQLASQSSTITFKQVQDALNVPEELVQAWIVQAVGRRILAARMNQSDQQLTVTQFTRAQFTASDWTVLHKQLATWQANVQDVLEAAQA